jgi:transcriptional regulator with XRE-family HTH domain
MTARSPDHAALGQAVRELRNKKGMTQEEVAEAGGLPPTYISDIERGVRNPSYEALLALAGGMGVKLSEIVARSEKGRGKR